MRQRSNAITASRLRSDRNGKTSHPGADKLTMSTKGKTRSAVIATRCQRDDGKITAFLRWQGKSLRQPCRGWKVMRLTLRSSTRSAPLAQPVAACIINLVKDEQAVNVTRPDPEEQAGRALRMLRIAKGWSQAEVARRMQAYGYDFHQTTIAKIEFAQRPLRVRELADFAALYGVQVHELVYPPNEANHSFEEIGQEIEMLEEDLSQTEQTLDALTYEAHKAQAVLAQTEAARARQQDQALVLRGRLAALREARAKAASWEN
jgi:transcriptional regulator with XRE-family HTH domain